jgi:hypothetical protein
VALKVKKKCYSETSRIIYQPTHHVIPRILEYLSTPLTEFLVQFPGLCRSSRTAKREKLPNKSTSYNIVLFLEYEAEKRGRILVFLKGCCQFGYRPGVSFSTIPPKHMAQFFLV